jgi:hypothetical protein
MTEPCQQRLAVLQSTEALYRYPEGHALQRSHCVLGMCHVGML